ncbi:VOC family protein [Streptomyces radicis]|uniref:Glyoxalase n=1 Tax=Streptomyces radicis TaxID=1750517 RepID=A0A3A9WPA3_9ACTN|nr:VOC family protein [Streptomyces radicis]RKN11324.1 glyoxalase [Streptomyces radicis]RKN26653.1 glyoxalase [Streptomyces radicis]
MTPRLDLIGIITDDMAASLAFYRRLGLDIPTGVEGDPHVEAVLPGGIRLAWDTAETASAIDPEWSPKPEGSRLSLAFRCEDAADVDHQYADLVQAGYAGEKEPWDAYWGQRYAVVHDPDGNSVDLFAPLG